jgi:hypothetical protein
MACGFTDVTGHIKKAASTAATSTVEEFFIAIKEAIGAVLSNTLAWWTRVDSINLDN